MINNLTPRLSKTCLVLGITLSLAAQIASTQSAAAQSISARPESIVEYIQAMDYYRSRNK